MEVHMIPKKKNIGVMVTIIILIIMVLGLTVYICYDKGLFSKDKDKKNDPVIK